MSAHGDFDVLVIGAGFGGMYMVHSARQHGLRVHALEAGGDVGGTWYWNRYPGARCDVESLEYSYGFSDDLQQDWVWTERYASQPEILAYADHVATRFDLRRDISFTTTVRSATFDEERSRWIVRTEAGEELSGQFLVTPLAACRRRTSRRSPASSTSAASGSTPAAGPLRDWTSPASGSA